MDTDLFGYTLLFGILLLDNSFQYYLYTWFFKPFVDAYSEHTKHVGVTKKGAYIITEEGHPVHELDYHLNPHYSGNE